MTLSRRSLFQILAGGVAALAGRKVLGKIQPKPSRVIGIDHASASGDYSAVVRGEIDRVAGTIKIHSIECSPGGWVSSGGQLQIGDTVEFNT